MKYIYIIVSLLLLFLSIILFRKKNLTIEAYKNYRKNTNICEKPFRPTCNKQKIFSRIRFLENKIDELEYDIYNQNKKFKVYDREFSKYKKNRELVKKDISNARNDAKTRIENIISSKKNDLEKQVLNQNNKKADNLLKQNKRIEKNNSKEQKKSLNKFKMSGDNPESNIIGNMINKSLTNGDENDMDDLKDSIKSLNMPSGFAF
uniref:Uncharacterized protein n=1 Tax=viral metagenome TaxID=1070528 RepID=A0A6C0IW63_9ZZZZ